MTTDICPPSPTHTSVPVPRQPGPQSASRANRAQRTADLLLDAAHAPDADERRRLLDEVVLLNLGVARAIASRYRRRGIADDDLDQVACLALVKAAQGFDPSSGHEFLSYAVPTIRGEVKRHFRDHGWMVRPPRRLQEMQARIGTVESELTYAFGRSPRPSEIAARLEEPLEDVLEALTTDGAFTPTSLDRPVGEGGDATIGELVPTEQSLGAVEARVVLQPVVRNLSERDRHILQLRFFRGWTQSEIAQDIGVTQMQVSRLLSRILRQLRTALNDRDLAGADMTSDVG